MSIGRRGMIAGCVAALSVVAPACGDGTALAADPAETPGPSAAATKRPLPGLAPGVTPSAETVFFADPRHAPVQVMRGPRPRQAVAAARPVAGPAPRRTAGPALGRAELPRGSTETVSFGTGFAQRVTVVRGMTAAPAPAARLAALTRVEKISFADPRLPAVTVMRGIGLRDAFSADLFDPANGGELDRIAFAVDGVESRHGADLRMWRPEFAGPQGPMQVSAAAALDVGGGNRFDLRENRLLGRAYLAQMFRRYGNWPDALAAYNWGPGNLDLWIAGGRNREKLPGETARYISRVLRDAFISAAAGL
jgi:hypothetical protein